MPRYIFSNGHIRVKEVADLSQIEKQRHALKPAYLLIVDLPHANLPPHAANNEDKETPDAL